MFAVPTKFIAICFASIMVLGCNDATKHARAVSDSDKNTGLTAGVVQSKIKRGMSSAAVLEALGNPNIVATDSKGREVWTYDRMSRQVRYSESSGGVWLILGAYNGSSGASSSTQSTLTVIVKFNDEGLVRDVAYHSSRF